MIGPIRSYGLGSTGRQPIAVIGMAGRFAGAADIPELWDVLRNGVDATQETPASRYDINSLYSLVPRPGKVSSRRAGYLRGVDRFDASFFGMSVNEAQHLDPQQRLLMMTAWEALEDAGILPARIAGTRTGVYVGASYTDYADLMARRGLGAIDLPSVLNFRSMLPARLSYLFDLRGPSLCLDTACSSSLVAIHLASQGLRSGETGMALAAGVSLKLVPDRDVLFSRARVIAPDGRCKFGDASADGAAFSEGVGVVVLKPLDRALADGDRVRAVILGSAVSNDGASSGSLLTPSAEGHAEMLRWAYQDAGVDPADVDFIEAHGNGTPVMDRVEFAGLDAVLGQGRPSSRPCFVGSVKTNIGHAESASGIAALIKTVLCLEHGEIVPSLHFHTPNPAIGWAKIPFTVPTVLQSLPDHGRPTVAGISGQGVSSVNAHLVVGQADPGWTAPRAPAPAGQMHLLVLSARTAGALADLTRAYITYLRLGGAGHQFELRDICFSAAIRRQHHSHRLAVAARTHDEVVAALERFRACAATDDGLPGGCRGQAGTDGGAAPDGPASPDVESDSPGPRLHDMASRYVLGLDVPWEDSSDPDARYVPLPKYPWQTDRHWLDSIAASGRDADPAGDAAMNAGRKAPA